MSISAIRMECKPKAFYLHKYFLSNSHIMKFCNPSALVNVPIITLITFKSIIHKFAPIIPIISFLP